MHTRRYSLVNSHKLNMCVWPSRGSRNKQSSYPKSCPSAYPSKYSLPRMNLPLCTHFPVVTSSWANMFYTPWFLLYSSEPITQMSGLLDAPLPFCWFIVLKLGSCVTLGSFLKWQERTKAWLGFYQFKTFSQTFGATPTCLLVSFRNDKCSMNNGKACKSHRLHCK